MIQTVTPYDIKLVFLWRKLHLFLGKSTKTTATRAALLTPIAPDSLTASPQTPLGSLQRSPDPLVLFMGLLLKGEGGKGERRRGREFVLCPRKKKESRRVLFGP